LGFLGAADLLVGTDKYSDWPRSVADLPKLGSDLDIDMEAVEGLKPDLVLASLSVPGMEKNIAGLQERGLPYLTLNPKKLADIARNLMLVGEAIGRSRAAEAAARKYSDLLQQYEALSKQVERRPSLYWEWWPKPVFTPGGGNWLTEISRLAGARNCYEADERASVKTDLEDVRSRDPDYILLAWVGVREQLVKPESLRERPGWPELAAIRENRVRVMEESLYCRPSPLLLLGLQKLGAMLHPGIYPAYDEAGAEQWLTVQ